MTAVSIEIRYGRTLISPDLFELLAGDVQKDHGHDYVTASRIVDQALVYLKACAQTDHPIGPSPLVDLGWHAFILRTAAYRQFCETVLGGFIDHYPNDVRPSVRERTKTNSETLRAVKATGLHFDAEMWSLDMPCSDCTDTQSGGDGDGCHQGCHDSKSK